MLKHNLEKPVIIESYRIHDKDTGSVFVQIALVSDKITRLSKHLEENRLDNSAKRSLLTMLDNRRKKIKYLRKHFPESCDEFFAKIGLRVKKKD